jgi:hypothetical protein
MRSIKPALVQVLLRRINNIAHCHRTSLHWRATAMP